MSHEIELTLAFSATKQSIVELEVDVPNCPILARSDDSMKPRHDLIDIFSTFLQFEEGNFSHWMPDPRLRRSMEKALQEQPLRKPEFWAIFWHRSYRGTSSPLARERAREHLWAYLEEARFDAATQVLRKYSYLFPQYTLADYCVLASRQRVSKKKILEGDDKGILTVEKILSDFNPQLNNSLRSFAVVVFRDGLIDRLRRENKCVGQSQWSLLRHVSETMLRGALNNFGVVDKATLCYLLAWDCFKEKYVCQGNIRKALPPPDENTWEEIAALYNMQMPHPINVRDIQKWMDTCGEAIRKYTSPPLKSLNATISEENTVELEDTLSDEGRDLLENIFIQEGSKNINSVLLAAITQLPVEQQLVLSLYYCEELSQTQIAQELAVNQATVSRILRRARRVLLDTVSGKQIVIFAVPLLIQSRLHRLALLLLQKYLNSDFIYKISQHIEAWLVEHCCWHLVRIFWIIIWLKASVKSAFKFKTVQFIYSGCF